MACRVVARYWGKDIFWDWRRRENDWEKEGAKVIQRCLLRGLGDAREEGLAL